MATSSTDKRGRPDPPPLPSEDELRHLHSISGSAALLERSEECINSVFSDHCEARDIASRFNLSVDSSILDASKRVPTLTDAAPVLSTTGGHSNVDHIVQRTGDTKSDRVAELKRSLKRRARAAMPETRGEFRWDQARTPGSRRRRIQRDRDKPSAPPEPPPSGYTAFVSQMTTKIRHDRQDVRHNQPRCMKIISHIWNEMSDADAEYYITFAREIQDEYQRLYREYRATGHYRPSNNFMRLEGQGPWVRCKPEGRNALEREIASYDTVLFPPRPPTLEAPAWERERGAAAKRTKTRSSKDKKEEAADGKKESKKDLNDH